MDGSVAADHVERPGIGLFAEPPQLSTERLRSDAIIRRCEHIAHIRVEGEHERQVILPADLCLYCTGRELHAMLVDRLQRSQAAFAPEMLREKCRGADGGGGPEKRANLLQQYPHLTRLRAKLPPNLAAG